MCFPSCKSLLFMIVVGGLLILSVMIAGPGIITTPMETARELLPTPHLTLTFGAVHGVANPIDYEAPFSNAGFVVKNGKMVPLEGNTCTQCMGSPSHSNPHLAVAMPHSGKTRHSCQYNLSSYDTCFKMRKTDSMIIITEGPPKDMFETFSWGVYLYDTQDETGRDLIQAPLYDPLRIRREGPTILILTFLADIADVLVESISLPHIDSRNIFVLPLSEEVIDTESGYQSMDRISVVLKSIPKDVTQAQDFYQLLKQDTKVLKLSLKDQENAKKLAQYSSYPSKSFVGHTDGKQYSERASFSSVLDAMVSDIKKEYNVEVSRHLTVIRDVFGARDIEECIKGEINCLAEDWDLSYSVSGPLIFPTPSNYRHLLIGIDHPEASLTTLGLFDVKTNQQVIELPKLNSQSGIYYQWMARNCSQTPDPCYEIPEEIAPGNAELYLRERIYGVRSYEGLVTPILLKIE